MSKIEKCSMCDMEYVVDDDGIPYYVHDHKEIAGKTFPTVVRDRWGSIIVDVLEHRSMKKYGDVEDQDDDDDSET